MTLHTTLLRARLFPGLLLLLAAMSLHAAEEPLDRVVVVVNDDVITQMDLEHQMQDLRRQFSQQGRTLPADDVIRPQILERLILTRVQLHQAQEKGIRVDDDTLDRTMENIASQNDLDLSQFRDTLEREGFNYARFREEVRNEIAINRLRQREIESRVMVTDQEVDNLLTTQAAQGSVNNEYLLSHILISIPEGAAPQQIDDAQRKAEQVLQALREGTEFETAAIQYSDGQQALQGGELGWRKAGQLPTLFEDLVIRMQPGDISELIRSPSGFHIIKLSEVRSAESERHIVKQTLARHILIKPDELTAAEDIRLRLERIKTRIEQGEGFAELAQVFSNDRASAANGGSLGWVNPGQMVPEFEQVMEATGAGQVSAPFQSRFGWHIVQVQERRELDNTEQYRRDKAREQIQKRKAEEDYQTWLHRVRDEAFVEMHTDG